MPTSPLPCWSVLDTKSESDEQCKTKLSQKELRVPVLEVAIHFERVGNVKIRAREYDCRAGLME